MEIEWFNAVIATLGLVVATITLLKYSGKKELVWDVSFVQGFFVWDKDPPFSPYPNETIAILTIFNAGNYPILKEDFETALSLTPLIGGRADKFVVLRGNEKFIESISINPNGVLLVRPRTLNRRDSFSVVIENSYRIQGHESLSLDGHIREIDTFETFRNRALKRQRYKAMAILCLALLVISLSGIGVVWYVVALVISVVYWFLTSLFRATSFERTLKKQWDSWFQDECGRKDFEASVKLSGDRSVAQPVLRR